MNPLPDIVVIDFCEWLIQKTYTDSLNSCSPLEILMDENKSDILREYAKQFLDQQKRQEPDCTIKTMIYQFLSSEEFNHAIRKCERECDRIQLKSYASMHEWDYCMHCLYKYDIEYSFRDFVRKTAEKRKYMNVNNISYYDLAAYMRHLLYSDNDVKNSPQFMQLMINSRVGMAEEIDFLEWLQLHGGNPNSIRKMPSLIFERLVDDYIASNKKSEQEKKRLIKAYRQTGWEKLFERFKIMLRMGKTRRTEGLDRIITRYSSHYARFNCIILPLSDKDSQRHYKSLITDSWHDLNELSEDYLDIYYSETDNGKSGYDIAKRISSLPNDIRKKAPCIVIWKYNLTEAKTIPIDELTAKQILLVIKCIVEKIQQNESLELIVEEASKEVKKNQAINHGSKIIHIEGHGNIVGDNNKTNTNVIVGDNNATILNGSKDNSRDFVAEIEKAIAIIKASKELDDDQKTTMCAIMEDAKMATIENSSEKSQKAKTTFSYIKSFLVKSAPVLISTLANLTKIASFFGLSMKLQ